MSTQDLESQTTNEGTLTAATVENVLNQMPNPSAVVHYPFAIKIFEGPNGRTHIAWKLDPNYAIGKEDMVLLKQGSTWISSFRVTAISGEVDTNMAYQSGQNACYTARNYKADGTQDGWRDLVVTPNT